MARRKEPPPRVWLRDGEFSSGTLDSAAPPAVVAAQAVASKLEAALTADGRPVTQVAAAAEVSRGTVYSVLAGRSFPDFSVIARLSSALDVALWP